MSKKNGNHGHGRGSKFGAILFDFFDVYQSFLEHTKKEKKVLMQTLKSDESSGPESWMMGIGSNRSQPDSKEFWVRLVDFGLDSDKLVIDINRVGARIS